MKTDTEYWVFSINLGIYSRSLFTIYTANVYISMASILSPHYSKQQHQSNTTLNHVWVQSNSTCRLGVPFTLCGKENDVSLDWRHDGRETTSMQEHERSTRRKSEAECKMYKPLAQNIRVRYSVWYFDPRIIPGTSHKLRLFWARPYQVIKMSPLTLAEIKPGLLSQRRETGEPRHVETVSGRRCNSTESGRFRSRLMVR